MTDLFAKLASVFVEPAPEAARQRHHRVAVAPPAPCVGVIATPRHALAVGSAVALVVARGVRARRALVCAWPPRDWVTSALQAPAGTGARPLRPRPPARRLDAPPTGGPLRAGLPEE